MEADLALHQQPAERAERAVPRADEEVRVPKEQYAESVKVLNTRLVDIYESDETSTIDVFLGSSSLQDAVDKVQYLNEIGDQDRRIATRSPRRRRRSRCSAQRRRSCAGRCRARPR